MPSLPMVFWTAKSINSDKKLSENAEPIQLKDLT